MIYYLYSSFLAWKAWSPCGLWVPFNLYSWTFPRSNSTSTTWFKCTVLYFYTVQYTTLHSTVQYTVQYKYYWFPPNNYQWNKIFMKSYKTTSLQWNTKFSKQIRTYNTNICIHVYWYHSHSLPDWPVPIL